MKNLVLILQDRAIETKKYYPVVHQLEKVNNFMRT
jgi:hypothetical protein